MIKKIDLALEALDYAGLISSSNPATPEATSKALKALERGMLQESLLNELGEPKTGYLPATDIFNVNGNADSGITSALVDDVVKYIVIDICEALAAPYTAEAKQQSRRAYRKLAYSAPPDKALATNVPAGQGNQRYCFGYEATYLADESAKDTGV